MWCGWQAWTAVFFNGSEKFGPSMEAQKSNGRKGRKYLIVKSLGRPLARAGGGPTPPPPQKKTYTLAAPLA